MVNCGENERQRRRLGGRRVWEWRRFGDGSIKICGTTRLSNEV